MEMTPRQEYRDLEKLGYLCRWTLLAGAAAAAAAAIWSGLLGVPAISADLETNVLLSDAVARHGANRVGATGFLDKPRAHTLSPLMYFQDHRGGLRLAKRMQGYPRMITAYFTDPPAGAHQVRLCGLPYGPMAFVQQTGSMKIVPRQMPVYLLDARFLLKVERSDKQAALRIANGLSMRIGQIVLILPPRLGVLKEAAGELAEYSEFPRIFSLRKNISDPMSVINTTTRRLRDKMQETTVKPYVITADAELAVAAAKRGHFAHLVVSRDMRDSPPPNVRLHRDANELADHLAGESSPH